MQFHCAPEGDNTLQSEGGGKWLMNMLVKELFEIEGLTGSEVNPCGETV